MCHLISETIFAQILGVLYTLIVGHLVTNHVVSKINEIETSDIKPDYLVFWIGHIERCLYLGSLILGKEAFIGIWLAFKALGKWETSKHVENASKQRGDFQRFLIGNGLSILVAGIGDLLFKDGFTWYTLLLVFLPLLTIWFPWPHKTSP